MGISPARQIAFDILLRVEAEGAWAGELLHARLAQGVKREDAALATELALGTLRWQRLLDFLVERLTKKPAAQLDTEVRIALRLGLYQLRFLERIPARAAVNEAVELVKRARKRSAAALVNAVLRRADAEARQPVEALLPEGLSEAERLSICYSHPTWLVERWLASFGSQRTQALLAANNRPPPLCCAVHEPAKLAEVRAELESAGLRVMPGRWLRSALVVAGGNPAATEAFRRGWISIQDEASQMVPLLLDAQPGEAVLDLCAAPGGKTAALARAAGRESLVVVADVHPHRLRATREHLARLGAVTSRLVALDAQRPLPFSRRFDRILVDAPCSGTGTLARNPEIRWRLRPGDLRTLHELQVRLLRQACELLASGGRLLYSTCSLEPEENEQVVAAVAAVHPTLRVGRGTKLAAALAPHLVQGADTAALFDEEGCFRTFPPEHGADGFFAAALEPSEDAC